MLFTGTAEDGLHLVRDVGDRQLVRHEPDWLPTN